MAQITMPKMSDTMEEGKIIRWLKHPGDTVVEGEPIAEIETDKANVEMEAFEAGVLTQILVDEGDTVAVGQPIAIVEAAQTAAVPGAPLQAAPVEVTEQMAEARDPDGYWNEQVPIVTAPSLSEAAPTAPAAEGKHVSEQENRIKASPLARRIAEENQVDLSSLTGTGPNGRIVEQDVEDYIGQTSRASATPSTEVKGSAESQVPQHSTVEQTVVHSDVEELGRMRKTIAERMTKSKQTIPHFYVTSEIDMGWASRVRDELNADADQPKVSFTDMIVKACALALKKYPRVNASYADGGLLLHNQINIGVAVALDDGLIAPVIHDADQRPIREISARMRELIERAKSNTLHTTDYTGAVFTVSNLGMFDVENFAAIINPPESASLAVGSIRDIPVVSNDRVVPAKRMKVTLSADHRVLDGAVAAVFLQEVKRRLESPIGLL
jgi:pyruvate dehydrogenase E2 component (dihydrolipoamide acetyltransferase)